MAMVDHAVEAHDRPALPALASAAMASVPLAIALLAGDASAQAATDVMDALQLALLLEHLESDFYSRGVNAAGLIPAADRTVFTTIAAHETAHVVALQAMIQGRGGTPVPKPAFDYTARGALPGFAFLATQYDTFRSLAQAFEDLGVRAYKGQVVRLINDKRALTFALAIHSVEARHAAEVRRLRGDRSWITGNSRGTLPAFAQPVYDGEENITQGVVNVTSLPGSVGGSGGATQAFDEPLTRAQALAILAPFLA